MRRRLPIFAEARLNPRAYLTSSTTARLALAVLASAIPNAARAAEAAAANVAVTYEAHVRPLFEQYCYECHGERKRAGLDLRLYPDAARVAQARDTFEEVLKNVRGGLMPPASKPQPSPAERARIANWLQAELFPVDCAHPDPGRVTIRRLNRTEYNHTIRDLVGVDFRPADDFPMDDVGYGFDNIGDVLSLPPLLVEKYLAAAERILDRAIITGPPPPPLRRYTGEALQGGSPNETGGRSLNSEGEISVEHDFVAGDYVLCAQACGDQAGPEPVKLGLRLAGKQLKVFEVTAKPEASQTCEFRVAVPTGKQRVAVAFLNDYYRADDPNPANRDRNLHLQALEIVGPIVTNLPPLPASHRRIFFAQPASASPEDRLACARQLVGEFARRAYRRPPSAEEISRLLRLFEQSQAEGESFEAGVKLALEAVLVSPHFLFRGELQPDPDNPRAVHPIDEFALASRLSYFLWSTMPDEELFRLAGEGRLRPNLEAQVRRMLADSKSRALVDNFAGQWLQFRNLDVAAPDTATYPDFNDALRTAMRREVELFVGRIFREDRSVLEFIDADWTYANGPLARHYGLSGVDGDPFRLVSLHGTHRGGVLEQASFLTITSNPTRTSPVKRGKWVLENLLNAPPPPPPPDVPLLDDSQQAKLTGSLRQRMEQHRADPLCASCHALMDPIGFGFENYDGVGRWREQDGGFPIDPAGRLVSGEDFRGPDELKRILLTTRREEFLRCLASKLLTYALGRGLEYYDQCAVDEVVNALKAHDCRFSGLVLGVVNSAPFQLRRGEAAGAGAARETRAD